MHAICSDYFHQPDGPVNNPLNGKMRESMYDPLPRVSPRIVASLMLAQKETDPEYSLIAPIYQGLDAFAVETQKNVEEQAGLTKTVFEVAAERAKWYKWNDTFDSRSRPENSRWGFYYTADRVFRDTTRPNKSRYPNRKATDENAQIRFSIAIIANDIQIVQKILVSSQASVNSENSIFGYPLHLAARFTCCQRARTVEDARAVS
jgi:hypothetical protein